MRAKRPRARSVREDWFGWLPAEKDRVFDGVSNELEACYGMLSVALDEAFALRGAGSLARAQEQAGVSADLFDRLAARLLAALHALEEHGRHFGTLPNVCALNPDFFRSESAQRMAWKSNLLSKVLFPSRLRFSLKLRSLAETVEDLNGQFRSTAEEIADGASIQPRAHWDALEILHYDVNTCLREATIVLKSFLCALPSEQIPSFRQKLKALAATPATLRHRRATSF